MNRKLRFLLCLGVVAVLNGCAMCDNGWDDAYNGYGGAVERQDRFHGRVGSILSDPTLQVSEPAHAKHAAYVLEPLASLRPKTRPAAPAAPTPA